MEKCPVCGNHTLVYDEYYSPRGGWICLTRWCGVTEQFSEKIKQFAKKKKAEFKTLGKLINDSSIKLNDAMENKKSKKKIPDEIVIHMGYQVW